MALKLAYKVIGEGEPMIILHGLFGSLDNWMTFARQLSKHKKIFLIDQRNHGQSPHSDEFNYDAMADDLKKFIDDHNIGKPDIMGHSMGGKTAMNLALRYTDYFSKLIVVDISPVAYPPHHDGILEGLKALDLKSFENREDADKALSRDVPEPAVRQFLLKNLKRTSQGFEWKINLKAIDANMDRVSEGIEERFATEKKVLFIRGSKSKYIRDQDMITIVQLFPNAEVKTIEGAGHWIHAEKPDELLEMVADFLDITSLD